MLAIYREESERERHHKAELKVQLTGSYLLYTKCLSSSGFLLASMGESCGLRESELILMNCGSCGTVTLSSERHPATPPESSFRKMSVGDHNPAVCTMLISW